MTRFFLFFVLFIILEFITSLVGGAHEAPQGGVVTYKVLNENTVLYNIFRRLSLTKRKVALTGLKFSLDV